MSKDIRSYFFGSVSKKPKSDEKPRKVISSDDEDKPSPKKHKKVKDSKKIRSPEKVQPKKRAIISSDEDEKDVLASCMKKKKAKIVSQKKDDAERLEEVNLEDAFNNKPVYRINAPKIEKKSSNKSKIKLDKDDNFDNTLNQLDTSQIEDEYLSALQKSKMTLFQDKSKKSEDKELVHKRHEANNTKDKVMNSSQLGDKKMSNKNSDIIILENKKKKKGQPLLNLEIIREFQQNETYTSEKNNEKILNYGDIIEERAHKKKQQAVLYQNYLNRGGARNPGTKEVPKGAENCFADVCFLITGILDSLEREEVEEIIKKYGGKILTTVSKRLNYLIVGDQPGPSKISKGESLGIKMISEDEFLELLKISPGKEINHAIDTFQKAKSQASAEKNSSKKKNEQRLIVHDEHKTPNNLTVLSPIKKEKSEQAISTKLATEKTESNGILINDVTKNDNSVDKVAALVEKYRPKYMKQLIGQTGDKSNAKKLHTWLKNWHNNHDKNAKAKLKQKFNPYARDDTGIIYKAALLSGPPGIGKTTTAYVVCSDLGFEVIEFNASDTRSKKLLQEEISGILMNKTVKSFLNNDEANKTLPKHVLLMDEVDGMAGNEDRGGIKELISFIKSTEIPIICICNDRQNQKIKSLVNYTFDLRFQKPRLEQIRGPMMSICFKEGIKSTPDEITRIIQSTNQDIRQVINHVAMLSARTTNKVSENISIGKYKNLRLGPWDVVRRVFSVEEHKKMSIHDQSDLFFHDYNIAPLFVEENYPLVSPHGPQSQIFEKLAKCSESLAIGDLVEKKIRSNQNWSLLPVQACFSSVIPGSVMSGFITDQINFPSWLGKNSRTNKCNRLLQDITVHTRTITGASKEAVNLDYLKMLVGSIVRPLVVEGIAGVEKAVEVMKKYHLSRDDLDSLLILTKWPGTRDLMQAVDSKTKTAFTKAYNKCASFSFGSKTKRSEKGELNDLVEDTDEEMVSENEEEEKIENDKLIKAKTSKAVAKNTKATVVSTSKGGGKKSASKGTKKK